MRIRKLLLDFFKEGKAVSLAEMEKSLKRSSDKFLREIIKKLTRLMR